MRANKIRTAGLLLGFGLGAFLEGIFGGVIKPQ